MFSSNLSFLRCSSLRESNLLKWSLRFYRGSNRNKINIGIKNRLKLFSAENPDIDQLSIDDRAFDELEAELTSGKHIVDLHKSNIERTKKKIEMEMIERKYFGKIKSPNFLMWAEKEQIKKLYADDPDFWTYNKLSESFPATPDIIMKIIKSNWKPDNPERIHKHDQHVKSNWEKLRKGEIQVDPVLNKHLSTFSSRKLLQNFNDNDLVKEEKKVLLAKGSEFAKIVAGHQEQILKLEEKNRLRDDNQGDELCKTDDKNELTTFEPQPMRRHKHLYDNKITTLDQLRKAFKKDKLLSEYTEYDKAFLNETNNRSDVVPVEDYEPLPNKFVINNKKISIQTVATEQDAIPMKINVPKSMPKASVFKVNDVYYDTDGVFLYRVPGMK